MELYLIAIVKAIILPPGAIIFGVLVGLAINKKWPRLSRVIIISAFLSGILVSLPIVAGGLANVTEKYPPLSPDEVTNLRADAIVILAGGKDGNRREYGGVTISKSTLQRVRYGAKLSRTLGLPILVSGGVVHGSGTGEARYMARILAQEFDVKPHWIEDRSRNTAQNARYTHEILGNKSIVLVTHALHMRRAVNAFSAAGMNVVPAPLASVAYGTPFKMNLFDFLPSEKALLVSRDALHELLGIIWYELRY